MSPSIAERRRACRELARHYYRDVPTREDVLDREITARLRACDVLLDAGCGTDIPILSRYASRTALAIGIDLCVSPPDGAPPAALVAGNLEALPFKTGSIDIIVSRSVFEHLADPLAVLKEMRRVLRPGGAVIATTPNKYYYSCLVARLVPERLKRFYFHAVFGEDAYDCFPVYYRANTAGVLRRLATAAGLRVRLVEAIRHYPYYLMFSPWLFRLGIAYDRLITAFGLTGLQSNWLVVMTKE